MSGYSKTPLAKKLGIKNGSRVKLLNAPEHYFSLFTDLPADIVLDKKEKFNFIHAFVKEKKELLKLIPSLKKEMEEDGMIWISWPKKSSQVESDVDENVVRVAALKNGLVDVKVCAIDDIWSGLKLVKRLKDRIDK